VKNYWVQLGKGGVKAPGKKADNHWGIVKEKENLRLSGMEPRNKVSRARVERSNI